HAKQVRMYRRLATGNLQNVGDAFELHVPVDGALESCKFHVLAARPRFGKTHGAFQIAARSDLHKRDAGVLLVLGTQTTVERAAPVACRAESLRQARGLVEVMAVEVGRVRADEVLHRAVVWAVFAEVDAVITDDDLGIHESAAVRAQAASGAAKRVI